MKSKYLERTITNGSDFVDSDGKRLALNSSICNNDTWEDIWTFIQMVSKKEKNEDNSTDSYKLEINITTNGKAYESPKVFTGKNHP